MKKQIKYVSYLVLMGIVAVGSARAEEMVKIALELPKAMFVGTPKNVKTKNLERPGTQRVTTMMAPAGTVNLAKDKAVESSDAFPVIGELSYVVDGDKEGADGSYVELGPGVQWVQVDLGQLVPIDSIRLHPMQHAGRGGFGDGRIPAEQQQTALRPTP